eukprot:g2351.t1
MSVQKTTGQNSSGTTVSSTTADSDTEKMFQMLSQRSANSIKFRDQFTNVPSSALTSQNIQRIINGIPPALRLEIAKVFAIIDDDSSGAISMDELASMFRDLGKPQSTRSMRAMFRIIDADQNGEIDFFEFQLLFWKLHQKASFEADTLHGSSNDIATAEVPDDAQHETSKANEKSSVMNNFIASSSAIDSSGQGESPSSCKERLWNVMEHPSSSPLALAVSVIIMGLILLSTIMFLLESYAPPKNYQSGGDPLDVPYYIELICVIAFTVEFALRLISTPNLCKFFMEFMNIVDLVAILPFYLEKAISATSPGSGAKELTIIRVVRLFRIFRLFKFSRYLTWIGLLARALRDSVLPLAMVFVLLLITVVIFASLMYTIERGTWDESMRVYISDETGKPSMFQSIVHGIYFGIVTSTTVGYGDQYPVTTLGKVVGGIGCICGILIMVIPISIFSNNFELVFAKHQKETMEKKEHIATEDLQMG